MAQTNISQTVSKMKGIKTTTLGWDVVVNYSESRINCLLARDFRAADTKQMKDITCQVTGTNDEGDPYTIDFKFELSAPLISFSKSRTNAVCNLVAPVVGGKGKTTTKKEIPIKRGVYTLHFKTLELASASGDNNNYTPPNKSFVFPGNNSDGFVVIDFRTSKSLIVDITAREGLSPGDYNKFIKAHKASLCDKIKTKLLTEFLNVRYELARVKSDRPVAPGMVDLIPRSFRFAAYEPGKSVDTVLSVFIQTRKSDNGEKERLDTSWDTQWCTTLQCSPIPTDHFASIIFNKHMIFDTIMRPALAKQDFNGKLCDTLGNITLDIDTNKMVKYPGSNKSASGARRTVDPINVTPPLLSLKFHLAEDGSTIYCSRTWKYEYTFGWEFQVINPRAPIYEYGNVKVTHELKKNNVTSIKPLLDDHSAKLECSIDMGMWEVTLKPDNASFWEHICGGPDRIPEWVKDLNVELPRFTIDLGSFDSFFTTNLLLPLRTKAVINVDKAVGLQIPGDLYVVERGGAFRLIY